MSLSEKVIAITGAGSGIGLATAQLLAAQGAKLALAEAQEKALSAVQDQLDPSGTKVDCTVLDVRSQSDVERWVQKTVQEFGKIDGVVTSAGVTGKQLNEAGIQYLDDDDWDFVFAVNLKGTLNVLRALVPALNDGASIVTIASSAGLMGIPKSAAYVASKHAVVGLSRTASVELGLRNIRVNCVCPGVIDTPMMQNHKGPNADSFKQMASLGRNGKPGEVANLVRWLLSDDSSFVTGTTQVIDGGFLNR